jgi:hypothetical protein
MEGEFLPLRTFRRATRSAAWRSVRADMSSTILCRVGSEEEEEGEGEGGVVEWEWDDEGGGGGVGDDDDGADVVAVARARTRRDGMVLLCACTEMLCA